MNTHRWILQQDPQKRPFITDVLRRVEGLIAAADASGGGGKTMASLPPPPGSVAVDLEMEMAPLKGVLP
jgi:hypothetical protein